MDAQPATITRRTAARVEDRLHLGPDAQVDDKSLLVTPAAPRLTDPFLVLAGDLFSSPGFDWHPHRGLQTVTLVLDGALEHGDNPGNAGALTAGDVPSMTAGRGIIHRELALRDERAHTVQLWVNPPAGLKMTGTRYQDLLAARRPAIERDGTRIDLISGHAGGLTGPALNHRPVTGAVLTLEPGRTVDHVLPAHDRAFPAVLSGRAAIGGRAVQQAQTAWSDPAGGAQPSAITLQARDGDQPAVVLAFGGQPVGQPVALGGPFVMNTKAGIDQAFQDYRNGERPARWVHDIAARRDDAGFELVGLRDYPVPHLDEPLPPSLGHPAAGSNPGNADLRRRFRPFRGKTSAAQPCGGRREIWKECDE